VATFPIAPKQPAASFNPASMRSRISACGAVVQARPHRTLKILAASEAVIP
jgi:hypothetical protein